MGVRGREADSHTTDSCIANSHIYSSSTYSVRFVNIGKLCFFFPKFLHEIIPDI